MLVRYQSAAPTAWQSVGPPRTCCESLPVRIGGPGSRTGDRSGHGAVLKHPAHRGIGSRPGQLAFSGANAESRALDASYRLRWTQHVPCQDRSTSRAGAWDWQPRRSPPAMMPGSLGAASSCGTPQHQPARHTPDRQRPVPSRSAAACSGFHFESAFGCHA